MMTKATYQHVHNRAQKLYHQSEELSFNAANVISKRLNLIAQQNPLNNAKELKEIETMVNEKPVAFLQAWQQMGVQTLFAQQHLFSSWVDNWLGMLMGQPKAYEALFYQLNHESLKIWEKGLQPIHRRVNSNVKRLG